MTRYRVRMMIGIRVIDFGGGYSSEDVKDIVRGYRPTDKSMGGQFYQRKGSSTVYFVNEEKQGER